MSFVTYIGQNHQRRHVERIKAWLIDPRGPNVRRFPRFDCDTQNLVVAQACALFNRRMRIDSVTLDVTLERP